MRPTPAATMMPMDLIPSGVNLDVEKLRGLRLEVRSFLADQRRLGTFTPSCDSWLCGWDEEFSQVLASRGWIGMAIPIKYGGAGRSSLERFVVNEELLAAGAPVAAHWVADRQTAPALLRYGTEEQRARYLPPMANGKCFFAIGLSEPDAGSDLASVQTKATRVAGGWEVHGTKVWTSGAHRAHAMFTLTRTSPQDPARRHEGLTQFIVNLSSPGVEIHPILLLSGEHHFNEVVLDGVFVPDGMVLGNVGGGWQQITSELAYERSGPERYLSTFSLLTSVIAHVKGGASHLGCPARQLGELTGRAWTLRQMSLSIASALDRGEVPEIAAALVKDMGTRFENDLIEVVRMVAGVEPDPDAAEGSVPRMLADGLMQSPGFTLRGGTNEILRGIIARALGLR
jgi:acyl-CoA dehydrogenase